jgi:hypothetical protein
MDVHIGREQITSWKDFLIRYLLIVAGILSAWAVNQWNEARQHRTIAEQTRAALQAELGHDLDELRQSLAFNAREVERVQPLRRELMAGLKAGLPPPQIEARILGRWTGELRFSLPSIRRDAWDAAVAGQAVTHLGASELRRYSAAYAALRLLDANGGSGSADADLRRRHAQWTLERQLGRSDATELARILVLWETAMQYNIALGQGIGPELGAALGPAAAASERTAASAGAAR